MIIKINKGRARHESSFFPTRQGHRVMLFNTTRHVLPRYFCTFYTSHNFSDESYQNFTASKIFNKGWHAALYIVQFPYPNDPISQLYNNWKPNLKCTKCCIVCTHYYSVYVYCIVLYTDHCEMITKLCYLESRFFNTSWGLKTWVEISLLQLESRFF